MQKRRDELAAATKTAEERIVELKREKADLIQENREALVAAKGRVVVAEQQVANLEEEKADLVQEQRDSKAVVMEMVKERLINLEEDLRQEYRDTLVTTEERLAVAQDVAVKLEKENADLMQKHRDAFVAARDPITVVAEKVKVGLTN
jgi:hypothetical protein